MNWTTDTPTKEGWYWYRDAEETVVVHVDEWITGRLQVVMCGEERSMELDSLHGQWAGPLEVPK